MHPLAGDFKAAAGHVHAGDFPDRLLFEQFLQQLAFSATEITHACGRGFDYSLRDSFEPELIQHNRLFDGLFLSCFFLLLGIRFDFFIAD